MKPMRNIGRDGNLYVFAISLLGVDVFGNCLNYTKRISYIPPFM